MTHRLAVPPVRAAARSEKPGGGGGGLTSYVAAYLVARVRLVAAY